MAGVDHGTIMVDSQPHFYPLFTTFANYTCRIIGGSINFQFRNNGLGEKSNKLFILQNDGLRRHSASSFPLIGEFTPSIVRSFV